MRIRAAVVEDEGAPFAIQELELGELRADEVLVEIAASGICHTDLICRDQWLPVPLPAVLGHEGAGVVTEVGSAVTTIAPGDRVAMSYDACGRCGPCSRGLRAYCTAFFAHNFASSRPADASSVLSRDGVPIHAHFFAQSSFATHAVGRESTVVKVPDGMPLEIAAPFGCGIQTGAGSVLNVFNPPAGSSIAVFGAGAVGLAAVLAAKLAGCSAIVVVDLRPNRLELALELGATDVVDANAHDPTRAVRKLTGGGADFSLEASGSPEAARAAAHCLAHTGTCGIVGAPAIGTEFSLDVNTILVGGRVVRGIIEGESVPAHFLPKLFAFWQEGRFPVDRLMTFYDFDEIDQAAHDAESGAVVKPVLRMQSERSE